MSGAMENRAAVFTSHPQDVEAYRNGAWWPGSLLGWRHDTDGGCQLWVRLRAEGAEDYWTALEYLRLPGVDPDVEPVDATVRHLSVVDPWGGNAAADSAHTTTMAAIRSVPAPAPRGSGTPARSATTATISLFPVRETDVEVAAVAAPAPRSGGRHRAPAAEADSSGRHRAADTGVGSTVRPGGAAERPVGPAASDEVPDAHPLTRPMRLDDLPGRVPNPRRAALDGRLAGR